MPPRRSLSARGNNRGVVVVANYNGDLPQSVLRSVMEARVHTLDDTAQLWPEVRACVGVRLRERTIH